MLNSVKTLRPRVTRSSERVFSLPLFTNIFTKPVSLFAAMFFSPRIIAAQVVVDDCIVYSSTQNFQ